MTGVKRIRLSARRMATFFRGQRRFAKGVEREVATGRGYPLIIDVKRKGPDKAFNKKQAPFTIMGVRAAGVKAADMQSDRGKIVCNGLVNMSKLSIRGVDYEVPIFSYVIIKRKPNDGTPAGWEGGRYIATCVNLKMDGYGATPLDAWCDMNINVREYILKILEHYEYSHTALENAFKQDRAVSRSAAARA